MEERPLAHKRNSEDTNMITKRAEVIHETLTQGITHKHAVLNTTVKAHKATVATEMSDSNTDSDSQGPRQGCSPSIEEIPDPDNKVSETPEDELSKKHLVLCQQH